MNELEEQINRVLSDPGQMERLAGLARSLMGSEKAAPSAAPDAPMPDAALLKRLSGLMQNGGNGRETALLEAMRPWLSEKRRGKMDRAMQLARMARLARLAMEEMGGGDNDPPL